FIEFGWSFIEFGWLFIEFKQWLGWSKTQILEQLQTCVYTVGSSGGETKHSFGGVGFFRFKELPRNKLSK
ncbi:hypothetical protein, partial [Nostoc sp. 'Peltigera malacea cyanobiont' DB3992]|uniref:hypothetical protein n=1 Tax=Nostoc sp. 'Peltigera malacea cyanobiont' DB3992 TaxID=1206980 RepID=UPI000C066EED